jgi:hypothetical protein
MAIVFLSESLMAQPLWEPAGKNIAAGSYAKNFQDVFSMAYQPAGLANSATAVGVYTESRFLLKELSLYLLDANFSLGKNGLGLGLYRFGNKYWYQQQFAFAYGQELGKSCALGLQFNYTHTKAQTVGGSGELGFKLGGLWHVNKQLHIGCLLAREQQEISLAGGLGFEASRDCMVTAEVISISNYLQAKLSFIYRVANALAVMAGASAGTQQNFAGINIYWNAFKIGFATGFHATLGLTPSIAVSWQRASE